MEIKRTVYNNIPSNWSAISKITNSSKEESNKSQSNQLLVYVLTYNLAGKVPQKEDLKKLFPNKNKYDLFAINTQECEHSIGQSFFNSSKDIWESLLKDYFSDEYTLIGQNNLSAFHIALYIRNNLYSNISSIKLGDIKTGFMNIFANKGALGISFKYLNKKILFINSHLTAGQNNTGDRNKDFERINNEMIVSNDTSVIQGLKEDNCPKTLTDNFDIVIWGGDFNYRISCEDKEEVLKCIQEEDFTTLRLKDQFLNEVSSTNFEFNGFDEGSIYFAPTYKFKSDGSYDKERIPSWCDRIIYKHKIISDLLLYRYNCIPSLTISDHKPVYAVFKLNVGEQKEKNIEVPQNAGSLSCNIY